MEPTREKAIELSRKLWEELSESGSKDKTSTSIDVSEMRNRCPFCEYVGNMTGIGDCMEWDTCIEFCPGDWPYEESLVDIDYSVPCDFTNYNGNENGLFNNWCNASLNNDERKTSASEIANIKIKSL